MSTISEFFVKRFPIVVRNVYRFISSSPVTVISDIDDTLRCSGGLVSGVDNLYPAGTLYPGATQFMFELSAAHLQCNAGDLSVQDLVDKPLSHLIPHVHIVTARANIRFLAIQPTDSICSKFRHTASLNNAPNWGVDSILYSKKISEMLIRNRRKNRKISNVSFLIENKKVIGNFVYVGDTGDIDEDVASTLVEGPHRAALRAVFLHEVQRVHFKNKAVYSTLDKYGHSIFNRRTTVHPCIFYFRTYIGAAIQASRVGLISKHAVLRVVKSASAEFEKIQAGKKKTFSTHVSFRAELRASEFNVDLERALEYCCDININTLPN